MQFNFLRNVVLWVAALVVLVSTAPASAAYQVGEGDTYLKVGGLLQVQASMIPDNAPDGDSMETEFYLRRMRLMFYGQVNKWLNFFVETDNANLGLRGDFTSRTVIQDAYLELNLHEALQVDVGMILIPFAHHTMQGATSLIALDYHSALVKYPEGSQYVWRDFGIMLRGMPIGKWLEYRLGVFNGVHGKNPTLDATGAVIDPGDPRNPSDIPRFTARLTFNILEDAEGGAGVGGMFYDGLYLSKTDVGVVSTKRVLSVGGAFDFQPGLVVTQDGAGNNDESPYFGIAADVFWDIPIGADRLMSINGQVNFFNYHYGDPSKDTVVSPGTSGLGIMSELGFRWNWVMPYVMVDWFDANKNPSGVTTGDYMGFFGGIAFLPLGNTLTFKAQAGADRVNGAEDAGGDPDYNFAIRLQAQLVF